MLLFRRGNFFRQPRRSIEQTERHTAVEFGDCNGWQVAALSGVVGEDDASTLRDWIHDRIAADAIHVAVDVVDADCIHPAVIRILQRAPRWFRSIGGRYELTGASEELRVALAREGCDGSARSLGDVLAMTPPPGRVADRVVIELAPRPDSAAVARRHLARILQAWDRRELIDVALLATNELVTNAIVHAGSPFEIEVARLPGGASFAVRDASFREVRPTGPSRPDATSGRGLEMVSSLADDFGVDETDGGKCVWFTLTSARARSCHPLR